MLKWGHCGYNILYPKRLQFIENCTLMVGHAAPNHHTTVFKTELYLQPITCVFKKPRSICIGLSTWTAVRVWYKCSGKPEMLNCFRRWKFCHFHSWRQFQYFEWSLQLVLQIWAELSTFLGGMLFSGGFDSWELWSIDWFFFLGKFPYAIKSKMKILEWMLLAGSVSPQSWRCTLLNCVWLLPLALGYVGLLLESIGAFSASTLAYLGQSGKDRGRRDTGLSSSSF